MAKRKNESGFSRRNFLKTVGAGGVAAGAVLAKAPGLSAQAGPAAVGPDPVPVTLTVNGRQIRLNIEPRTTLLDALRMHANEPMTGNKRGCDRGACGACTMIVDGRTVYSCSTLAIEVQGKKIRTVDGLASGGKLHPVQQAFCDKDALMCGFCTPGFVMATVSLLQENPDPSEAEIRDGLEGNLCRCTGYHNIVKAVQAAARAGA